jgi:hypothetical protein
MSKSLSELKAMIEANDRKLAQLQSLHNINTRADENLADYEVAQRRAADALQPFGRKPSHPTAGEPITVYRRRLCGQLQAFAPKWRDFPLAGVRTDAFASIETQIYADAAEAAKNGPAVADGELACVSGETFSGAKMNTYYGSPRAWMDALAGPVRQFVKSFNDKQVA